MKRIIFIALLAFVIFTTNGRELADDIHAYITNTSVSVDAETNTINIDTPPTFIGQPTLEGQ